MSYVTGMDEVCSTPDIVRELFALIDNEEGIKLLIVRLMPLVLGVCRTALELLFIICSYSDNGFTLIDTAAKSYAKEKDQGLSFVSYSFTLSAPYANVINRLSAGDQDIKMNALTLLNVTMNSCADETALEELLKTWTTAGILEVLKVLSIEQNFVDNILIGWHPINYHRTNFKMRQKSFKFSWISLR